MRRRVGVVSVSGSDCMWHHDIGMQQRASSQLFFFAAILADCVFLRSVEHHDRLLRVERFECQQ